MHRKRALWATLSLISVLLLAATTAVGAAARTNSSRTLIKTAHNATLGTILVAPSGKTLYRFSLDRNGKFGCTGGCLKFWFPLTAPRGVKVPGSVSGVSSGLGAVARGKNTVQITYRHHPLYTFIGDQKAGQTAGQGFRDFGGVWSAATVSGTSMSGTGGNTGGSGGYNGYGGY